MRSATATMVWVAGCFIVLAGCAVAVQGNSEAVRTWLEAVQTGEATDVNGNWVGPPRGWGYMDMFPFGTIMLVQQGHKLTGTWAEAEIQGAVNDTKVTLVAIEHGKVIYTFHLTVVPNRDAMLGKYCEGYHPDPPDDHCIVLTLTRGR